MLTRALEALAAPAGRHWPRMVLIGTWLLWTMGSVIPVAAQYTAPGSAATTNDIPSKESFDESIQNARWNLGAVHLSPWLGLRDASFVTNRVQGEDETDFTVTAGAGLRAYSRIGPKVVWSAHALPEYVWWQDLEDKRRLNGRYGLGFFGYFNRFTAELSQRLVTQQAFFSNEVQQLTSTEVETSRLALELAVANSLTVYGFADREDRANKEDEQPVFGQLDRQDDRLAIGVRLETTRGWTFGLGYEDTSTEFAEGSRDLSSSGDAETVLVGYQSPRVGARLDVALRQLEAEEGSEFSGLDETTGRLEVLWATNRRLSVLAYARRDLGYSIAPSSSHSLNERQGLLFQLDLGVGRFGSALGIYGELGEDDYIPVASGDPNRLDDVTVLGAELSVQLRQLLTLSVVVSRTEYESSVAQFDREITTAGLNIRLGSIIRKLGVGQDSGAW